MHVFVSHAAEDAGEVGSLISSLQDHLPQVAFFVSTAGSLKPGEQWWSAIQEHLRQADAVLVVLSRRSASRPWLFFESGAAWAREIPVIPVLLDDLTPAHIPSPLSLFQAAYSGNGLVQDLAKSIAAIGSLDVKPVVERAQTTDAHDQKNKPEKLPKSGLYTDSRSIDLKVGWVRYAGTIELSANERYIDPGPSFNEAHRFPPDDTLCLRCRYFGLRVMRLEDIHFYIIAELMSGRRVKFYLSTNLESWGFTGDPRDEFRIPLGKIEAGKWQVLAVRLWSLDQLLGSPVKAVVGFRIRGGCRVSHIWCFHRRSTLPTGEREAWKELSYPA